MCCDQNLNETGEKTWKNKNRNSDARFPELLLLCSGQTPIVVKMCCGYAGRTHLVSDFISLKVFGETIKANQAQCYWL